eukprot:TRINITY_DN551_c0_g1_i1.p1 TRINITY_DN551_c0_g1~~TRINITY_DN551_c0_g1_i1.p1  ORF type:complete len:94 (+),score=27.70 TRINITY_DN551_c0_g1_i1:50-331(+)
MGKKEDEKTTITTDVKKEETKSGVLLAKDQPESHTKQEKKDPAKLQPKQKQPVKTTLVPRSKFAELPKKTGRKRLTKKGSKKARRRTKTGTRS